MKTALQTPPAGLYLATECSLLTNQEFLPDKTMRNSLHALVYKILVVIGALILPYGVFGSLIIWDDYWLRSYSQSVAGAVVSIDVFLLMVFVGALAFVTGLVKLGPEKRGRYAYGGLLIIFLSYLALFLFYSMPRSIPLGKP